MMEKRRKKRARSFAVAALVCLLAIWLSACNFFGGKDTSGKPPVDDNKTEQDVGGNGGEQGDENGNGEGGEQGEEPSEGGNSGEQPSEGGEQGEEPSEGGDNGEQGGEAASAELNIYFPELGNGYAGDCVLIKIGDTEVLIDAGSRKESAATLVPYIKQYCTDGILEYVIATHAHQDHIAAFVGKSGTDGIFAQFECKTIIDYARTNSTTQIRNDYEAARSKEVAAGAVHYTALQCWNNADGAQRSYEIADGVTMNILYNYFYEHSTSDENDYSVCMLLSQGENHFLFTGDLEESGEKYLVQYNPDLPHVKLFKAGHHGSKTSSNDVLLSKITPENVCVCCCAGSTEYTTNKNNTFPTQAMINRVAKYTKNIYVTTMSKGSGYTSMNGNITVTLNAEGVAVHGSNNDTILKDTEWFKSNRIWPAYGVE